MTKSLDQLLKEAKELVNNMTPEQKAEMIKTQAKSWAEAESKWPQPKFKHINGAKIYDSYEDYCND